MSSPFGPVRRSARTAGELSQVAEMALRPDDDIRLFIENRISGFKTDGATGCFAEAGAWVPLLVLFEKGLVQGDPGLDPDAYEDISDSMYLLRTRDQASGGELAAFATTSDGTRPVWAGRTEAGEVVAVAVLVDGMPELLPDPYAARRGAESACPRNHDGAGGPRQPRWACHPEKAMCGTADQV
ncbi:hypothetical protein ACGFYF_25615 [Streptomyces lavendulae]|uniref:hypothetical protein n=1 Tax=Streptomyces lavendulae TaxID=1914 RepID=UPI00255711BF|nr:hypothetical protein [Streptomyces lavendulae]